MPILKDMYPAILTKTQKDLIPFFEPFTDEYFLVGGTAIALHLGHRRSIDFDFFTNNAIKPRVIKKWMENIPFEPMSLMYEDGDQIHMIIRNVKVTFISFSFEIQCVNDIHGISMPSLLTLAAMKAFALGGRAKWKNYVD